MNGISYIETKAGLSMVLKGKPYSISRDNKHFEEVRNLVTTSSNATEDAVLDVLERDERRLKQKLGLTANMYYAGGVIVFNGEVLNGYASDCLVKLVTENRNTAPLANFVEKLQKNPSKRVVDHLYAFIEHGGMPITPDGDFLAYKRVRNNYKDCHSGTFDNSVGKVCEMQRNRVDEDPNNTCSSGLHVCSYAYLSHFGGERVVVCKINPADVVAIPADYNNTKMRVSRYEVVDEVTKDVPKKDVLGDIGRHNVVADGRFKVMSTNEYGTSREEQSFFSMVEAKRAANHIYDSSTSVCSVEIIDEDGMVILTLDENGWN